MLNDGWSGESGGGLVTSAQAEAWVREARDAPGAMERNAGLIPALPVAEPLAAHLERVGLTWTPEKVPLYTSDGEAIPYVAVRHPKTHAVFQVASPRYSVIPWEAADMLQPIVDAGVAKWDGILLLRGGALAVVRTRLAQSILVRGDDSPIHGYLNVVVPHDGSMAFRFMRSATKPVCENTLARALREAKGAGTERAIRHTAHALKRVRDLKEAVARTAQGMARLQAFGDRAAQFRLSAPQWTGIVERIIPGKVEDDGSVTVTRQAEQARDKLHSLYEGGALGTTEAIRGTAWQAVNAATEYADHYLKMRNDTPDARMDSALFGRASGVKDAAFDAIEEVMGELV